MNTAYDYGEGNSDDEYLSLTLLWSTFTDDDYKLQLIGMSLENTTIVIKLYSNSAKTYKKIIYKIKTKLLYKIGFMDIICPEYHNYDGCSICLVVSFKDYLDILKKRNDNKDRIYIKCIEMTIDGYTIKEQIYGPEPSYQIKKFKEYCKRNNIMLYFQ